MSTVGTIAALVVILAFGAPALRALGWLISRFAIWVLGACFAIALGSLWFVSTYGSNYYDSLPF